MVGRMIDLHTHILPALDDDSAVHELRSKGFEVILAHRSETPRPTQNV
jgi:hypothetical protein